MEQIGQGFQYKAFLSSAGRVVKRANSIAEAVEFMQKSSGSFETPLEVQEEMAQKFNRNTVICANRFARLIDSYPALAPHLGNPAFADNGNYEQDYVTTLHNALKQNNTNDEDKIFHSYAEGTLLEWSYGFSDLVYNFTFNSGLNRDGDVVFIDFLESTFDRQEALESVRSETWLHKESFKYVLTTEQQNRFARIMHTALTEENFMTVWGTNLDHI